MERFSQVQKEVLLCYPDLSIEILKESYCVYGGVARFVFHKGYSVIVPTIMEEALADVEQLEVYEALVSHPFSLYM
jgi:hypothetical protein